MLTINSANNGGVYFNPTFKLKYRIIFITEYLNIKLKLTCLTPFIWSGCRSLMRLLLLVSPCLSAFIKSILSDSASTTGLTGYSVPPVLKKPCDVFNVLVSTWYRSTGSFDNTSWTTEVTWSILMVFLLPFWALNFAVYAGSHPKMNKGFEQQEGE